jgi:hypothetical protein
VAEDPQHLEREIERTRTKLGEDIDALEEKVNPKKVAHRSLDRAKEKVAEVKDKVTGAASAAKDKVVEAEDKVSSDPGGPGPVLAAERGGGLGDKVSGLVDTAREKAAPLAATAKDRVTPLAVTAKEKAAERVGMDPRTADSREVATAVAGGAWSTLLEQTRRNPVAVGAAALAVGLVLGRR